MTTTRPELGFERLLAALGRDMLDASDEEILAVANELGQKPGMKGSIALLGVTFAWRLKDQPWTSRGIRGCWRRILGSGDREANIEIGGRV